MYSQITIKAKKQFLEMQLQTKSKIENIILMFSVSWFLFSNWHKLSLSLSQQLEQRRLRLYEVQLMSTAPWFWVSLNHQNDTLMAKEIDFPSLLTCPKAPFTYLVPLSLLIGPIASLTPSISSSAKPLTPPPWRCWKAPVWAQIPNFLNLLHNQLHE